MALKAYLIFGQAPRFVLVERWADETIGRALPISYATEAEAQFARDVLVGEDDDEDYALRERERGAVDGVSKVTIFE